MGSYEERPKHLITPPQIRRTQEAAPKPGAAFMTLDRSSWGAAHLAPRFSSHSLMRYASANPICATNIITYMWVQEGWFSVRARSSGRRTMR